MAYNSAYTGSQVDAGIAKANSAVQTDGSVPMTGALDMGGQRVTNVGAPTAETDVVRQSDLKALSDEIDNVINGTTPVTIPVATEVKAGIVKPGTGMAVTADGTLNNTLTLSDLGGVPNTRTVNGKALSADINLSAADVGARPTSWTPTAADVGAVPTDRTVNGKALGADISLSAADVGAATTADVNTAKPLYIHFTGEDKMNLSADHTVDEAVAAYNAGRDVKAVYEGAIYELRSVAENPQASAEFDIVVANAIKVLFMVGGNTAINMTYDEKLDAYAPLLRTSTLTTAGWSGNSQTVSVLGVSADSDSQLIYVSPADKASATAWGEAGVFCSAQGANSLTFVCDSTPSASINIGACCPQNQSL